MTKGYPRDSSAPIPGTRPTSVPRASRGQILGCLQSCDERGQRRLPFDAVVAAGVMFLDEHPLTLFSLTSDVTLTNPVMGLARSLPSSQ